MYINKMFVKNYRSLKDITIKELSNIVVFFGDNDTGKSNVLSLLETVFQRKYILQTTSTSTSTEIIKTPTGFWYGIIDNFSDNFFRNEDTPVWFELTIRFNENELPVLPKHIANAMQGTEHELIIEGEIHSTEEPNQGLLSLSKASLNQIQIFDTEKSDSERYFPGSNELAGSEAVSIFEQIMQKLDNAFLRIPANRFLDKETELPSMTRIELKANSFKNWLFSTSLDRNAQQIYHEITKKFGQDPFNKGFLSLARVGNNELEILVEDKYGHRLPIERKGTGVQQILIILAYIEHSKASFFGIEELEINLSPQSQKAIFNTLRELVETNNSSINQIFLTTHSKILASNNLGAERRQVTITDGITTIEEPTDDNITDFFNPTW